MNETARRFFEKIRFYSDLRVCWVWKGAKNRSGYGNFYVDGKTVGAHRFAYQWFIGVVHPELDVHHTCENKLCVNPRHLKLEFHDDHTSGHSLRSYCIRGHEMKEPNLYRDSTGRRRCRACKSLRDRRPNMTLKAWIDKIEGR